jgi:hypothetical protein
MLTLILPEYLGNSTWTGLTNPDLVYCSGDGCIGKLVWISDEEPFSSKQFVQDLQLWDRQHFCVVYNVSIDAYHFKDCSSDMPFVCQYDCQKSKLRLPSYQSWYRLFVEKYLMKFVHALCYKIRWEFNMFLSTNT